MCREPPLSYDGEYVLQKKKKETRNVLQIELCPIYMRYQAFITRHWLSARGCMVERLQAFVGYVMKWKETEGRGSSWARVSEYGRGGTTSFMTSRALRYSPTLSQSCSGHKVNIRHQRAARVTAFPVSILPAPVPPQLVCASLWSA